MRRIDKKVRPGQRIARALLARGAKLVLAYDERSRSRLAATLDTGEEVAVFMPRGTILRNGDVLVADDGGFVEVLAAPQPVLRASGTPAQLIQAAYHLGNRHTPVQLDAHFLQIEPDPVLRGLLQSLGLSLQTLEAPFDPEAGAYAGGHKHGLDETFAEDYQLAQQAYAAHDHAGHDHAHGHDHSHGSAHGHHHDHGHNHDHGDHDHDHSHSHAAHDHAHDHGHGKHSHGHDHQHGHEGHGHSHDPAHAAHDHAHDHTHDHAAAHTQDHEHGHGHDHGGAVGTHTRDHAGHDHTGHEHHDHSGHDCSHPDHDHGHDHGHSSGPSKQVIRAQDIVRKPRQ